jgi:hypothetical protein
MGRARQRPYVLPVEASRWEPETRADCPEGHAGEACRVGGPEHQDASENRSRTDKHPRDNGHPAAQGARLPVGLVAGKVSLSKRTASV